MEPVPMFEVLRFFEWVNAHDPYEVGAMREYIFGAARAKNRNVPVYRKALECATQFVSESESCIPPYALLDAAVDYLFNSKPQVQKKVGHELFHDRGSSLDNELAGGARVPILYCMIDVDNIAVVVHFLDWVAKKGINPHDISLHLEAYIEQFCNETGLQDSDDRRAIENFYAERKRRHSKQRVQHHERYFNSDIWKCVFLGLTADQAIPNVLTACWEDLEYMTADFLDIFYNPTDLQRSGYAVANELMLEDAPLDEFPCILVWRESIEDARYISVAGLDERGLFETVACLVMQIRKRTSLDVACEVAREAAQTKRNKRRPVVIEQSIGTNYGVVSGINEGQISQPGGSS